MCHPKKCRYPARLKLSMISRFLLPCRRLLSAPWLRDAEAKKIQLAACWTIGIFDWRAYLDNIVFYHRFPFNRTVYSMSNLHVVSNFPLYIRNRIKCITKNRGPCPSRLAKELTDEVCHLHPTNGHAALAILVV